MSDETSDKRVVPDIVPARMINETLYCERLLHLEWAQGEFADNYFTADGSAVHKRVDEPGGNLPDAIADDRPYEARSVWLSSDKMKISAKIDFVEAENGVVTPIEYKRGRAPDVPEGAYLPERAQVCAQVLLLREHGYKVERGEIYFDKTRRRVPIEITDDLIATALAAAKRALEICASSEMPPPLVDSPKCAGCSLIGICLPDEVNYLTGKHPKLRRFAPPIDDRAPLHVQDQGARVGLRGECLLVRTRDGEESTARLAHTSEVAVYGNVQVSTQAMRELLFRSVPVSFFTTGGWYCGRAISADSNNVAVRVAQFHAFADEKACLRLARGVVASKIRNCRTMLRRNGDAGDALRALEEHAANAEQAASLAELLGVEGSAARIYFGTFSSMLSNTDFDMEGRNRRPPRDPVNALLSLAYALLAKDFTNSLAVAGLDPMLGFYHQPRFGRPSLALDLMEEFRPVVADSIVATAINTGVVSDADFVRSAGAVALTPIARRNFLQAYERRMDQEIAHPVFGYKLSYRRVLEVQARLLTRVLLGEIPDYPHFKVR